MNTPVNFETAKLLKEKGFDVPVRHSYGHEINPHIAYPNEDYSIPSDFNSPNMGRNWKRLYSAPTITEVVMWLYEKYGIWTVVNVDIMGYWYFEHFNLKKKRNAQFEPTDTHYYSLTEVYEAAITYCLNNLI